MPKPTSSSSAFPHAPSSSNTLAPSKFDSSISPSSPRQLPKLRSMFTATQSSWKPTGQKRHRDAENREDPGETREVKRPIIKLKVKKCISQTQPEPKKEVPVSIPFLSDTSSCPMEVETRPSTPSSESPIAKRPRSHSNSSIVGLLFDERDSVSSSPIDKPGSPSASPPVVLKIPHPPHVSSPLASAPVFNVPLELPPNFRPFNKAISDPTSAREIDLAPSPGQLESNPKIQLARTRQKMFLAEVEALGTEMNNVFKLGYGRGMGRAVSGGLRGPSRLRSGTKDEKRHDERMDIDE
ncbi:uncharacterized protein IL334_001823 [Kwoniella shivajii]|uniref:Uncharacterized protein n=1 Tax=Kwoniella shivajii TaxID=564305 RepID=A0ABZ1CX69_9TREE|nr:hypothetical protein IL334_001823 [Kwoniella shivajii]